jgi:hypothetical protein
MGVPIAFYFYFKKIILIGSSATFLEHGALPKGSTSLNPSCKIETNASPNSLPF